ncbi:hypothetical protein AVEN_224807-1 [Araneus ventricosus]|uniref:Uncharacterized protein n=1 Tax=Araneus ventricosus TaxID=182803 RepID=A0A4Y2FXM3_ARAVE|nr:hypothetical protein AVEN_224807-1 [Araneus ventricosus]
MVISRLRFAESEDELESTPMCEGLRIINPSQNEEIKPQRKIKENDTSKVIKLSIYGSIQNTPSLGLGTSHTFPHLTTEKSGVSPTTNEPPKVISRVVKEKKINSKVALNGAGKNSNLEIVGKMPKRKAIFLSRLGPSTTVNDITNYLSSLKSSMQKT